MTRVSQLLNIQSVMMYKQGQKQQGWSKNSGPLRRKDKHGKHNQTLLTATTIATDDKRASV